MNKKKPLIVVGVLLVILLAVYLGFAIYFQSHFLFSTTVNGVEASAATVEKVEGLITEQVKGYELTIQEKDDATETINGEEIALAPVFDDSIEQLLDQQNGFAWIASLFKKSDLESKTAVAYDETAMKSTVEALNCMQNQVQPVDAYISDYSQENGYQIVEEIEGSALIEDTLLSVLDEAVTNLKSQVSLVEESCYQMPQITREDENLNNEVAALNTYAGASITYPFGSTSEVLDGNTISQWLSVGEDNTVSINEEAVAEYVSELASNHNTVFHSKSLATSYGTTVTITDGDYGWWIDKEGEKAQLLADITAGNVVERDPVYKQTANSHDGNDYGNTYVEINLTAQHLFYYKDGALVVESDFVSGNVSKGYNTPTGAYGLTYKEQDATLNGENYSTPVSFWMPFCNNVGMHDATWRDDFGGNYYKTTGSHGCINLPYSAAQTIFQGIADGDAVLVYELPGTESEKAKAQDSAAAVKSAISAIGDVTLDSAATITSVRAQYDALSETAKGYVTNYDVLVAAETTLAQLQAQAATDAQMAAGDQTPTDGQNTGN